VHFQDVPGDGIAPPAMEIKRKSEAMLKNAGMA
jgi:hypothetical protein